MNRNRKLRKQMMSGLAVGMAAVMGAAPVYAATGEDAAVSKEETVYVNANADGSEDQITVSNWLKNAGTEKNLQDESELKDIKNVKGDEEFTQSGNKLTWQTDGEDIYYQGTTTKEPPVSVKFTYYLDGKEIKPDDLAGKSGKLKIKVDYTNNTKTTVDINGKKETMYTPFVLMTGMILPQDTFSNVKIDNGKVISDGSRNIVIGFGMPGLQESLGLNSDSLEDLVSGDSDFELPESLEITADVENFSLDSTFTVALDDVLDTIDTDNITGYDDLKGALSDLEDAAMELVDGSKALSDGVDTLKDSYKELDDGIGTLKDGADELNSDEMLAKEMGISTSRLNRIIRLSEATKAVCDAVDDNSLELSIASDLSFLSPKHQNAVIDLVGLNLKPTVKRVQRLRDAEKRGNLDDKTMRAILEDKDIQPVKPPEPPKPAPTQPDPPFPVASMVTPNVSPAPAPTTGTSPVTLAPPNMKPVMPEPPKQENTARPPATQTVEKLETAPTSASNVIPISAESKQPGDSKADEEPIAHNSQRDSMYSTKVVLGGDRLRKYFPDVSMTPDEIVDSIYSALEERRQREARMKQKTEILHPGKPDPTR